MTDTTTDLTERLGVIRGWAADAEPATDAPGAAALRVIGHLCDVVQQLTERVESLQQELNDLSEMAAEHVTGHQLEQAIRRHRDTTHLP